MTTKQTEALRLADAIKASGQFTPLQNLDAAAAELRLLHAENETLRAGYDAARLEIASLQAQPTVAPTHQQIADYLTASGAWVTNEATRDAAIAQEHARKPLTDKQIEAAREAAFSTNNPFCPVDRKAMLKAARAIEAAHGITAQQGDAT